VKCEELDFERLMYKSGYHFLIRVTWF